jgi:3-hydroxyacyl-[acyl-carrier-protein] dehydratase
MLIDNLYQIEDKNENEITIKLSDKNHPIFKAHFPTQPILPGFIYFDIVSQLYNLEVTTIKKAKFLKPALPDQIIVFQRDNNKFKILHDNNQIANFVL